MFKISIEQSVLSKALEYLEPTVGKNTSGLNDNCISMKTTGNGSVELYTTNTIEYTSVEAIISSGCNTKYQCPLVDFKRFKAIINSISSSDIVVIEDVGNGSNLIAINTVSNIANNKKPVKLCCSSSTMLSLPSNFISNNMIKASVPKAFALDVLNNACSIIDDSSSAPIYGCVRFYTDGMKIEATVIDFFRKRMFVQDGLSTVNNGNVEFLVEASKLKKSMKLFEDFNEMDFSMDTSTIVIQASDPVSQRQSKSKGMITGINYFCRRLSGAFPKNIKQSFYPLPPSFIELNKQDVISCINRIKAVEDSSSTNLITISTNANSVKFYVLSTLGCVDEDIVSLSPIASSFNSMIKYTDLIDILKTINTPTFEIGLSPSNQNNYIIRAPQQQTVMFTIRCNSASSSLPTA